MDATKRKVKLFGWHTNRPINKTIITTSSPTFVGFFVCGMMCIFGQIALGWCIIADENPDYRCDECRLNG